MSDRDRVKVGVEFLSLDTPLDEVLHRPAARLVTRVIAPLPIHPNHVTVASLAPATGAALAFSKGEPGWIAAGLAAFWAWAVTDHADGELARAKHLTSDFGKQLDDACDAVASGVMMAGLFWGLLRAARMDDPLLWSLVFASAVVLNEAGHHLATVEKRRVRREAVAAGSADAATVRQQKLMDVLSGRAPFYILIFLALGLSFLAPAGPAALAVVMTAGTFIFASMDWWGWARMKASASRR